MSSACLVNIDCHRFKLKTACAYLVVFKTPLCYLSHDMDLKGEAVCCLKQ